MPLTADQLAAVTATPLTLGRYVAPKFMGAPYIAYPWVQLLERKILSMLYRPGVEILIVSVPPQEGKTTYCGMFLPAWYLGRNPGHQVILVSYNETQASKWGLRTRTLLKQYGPGLFDVKVNPDSDSASDWKLMNGFGGMMSAGIRGGITGNPGHLILLDDTLKGDEDANSPTIKQKNLDEWDGSITTRFQENTKVIITATRWAEDDLSGHIIERALQPGYDGFPVSILNIKALAEPDPDVLKYMTDDEKADWRDELGRQLGEGLKGQHSQRFFQVKKASTPPGKWMALHQGTPTASEGGMFPEESWRFWLHDGETGQQGDTIIPPINTRVRVWDLASSEGAGDWTVGSLWGRAADGRLFLLDRQRFRHAPGGVDKKVKDTAESDGYEVQILIEKERSGAGETVVDNYKRTMPGYSVEGVKAEGDKESRATPYSIEQMNGRVYLPRHASWVNEWVKEHSQMDGKGKRPKHDDQIDTGAYAVRHLLRYGGSHIVNPGEMPPGLANLPPEEQLEVLATLAAIGAI